MSTTAPQPSTGEAPVRERILRCTLELVGRDGIGELTNRGIATEAAVSLGSLTYHFPRQEDLLRESLELHIREETARIERLAVGLRERRLTPDELAAEIQHLAALSAVRPELVAEFELHMHAARNPLLRKTSRLCFAAYEAFAAAALAALGVPEPDRHAGHVVGLLMGIGIRQLGTGEYDAAGLADGLRTIAAGASARARTSRKEQQK